MIHRLRINTRERGYAVRQNYAVSGALGVGYALTHEDGTPVLAISVSAITNRMPFVPAPDQPRFTAGALPAQAAVEQAIHRQGDGECEQHTLVLGWL